MGPRLRKEVTMDVNAIVQIISTLGFPIAVCIYMAWDRHTSQKDMIRALDNNTDALNLILEHIRKEDSKNGE